MDVHTLLLIVHVIGTVLGVGAATFAEIFYLRAARDGVFEKHESGTLQIVYIVMRIGLFLAVTSGFGFLVEYRLEGNASYLFNEALWAKIVIVLVIMINALLLTARRVPMWLGSALSLTSWYGALVVGFLIGPVDYGFFEILGYYVVSVFTVAVVLAIIRSVLQVPHR